MHTHTRQEIKSDFLLEGHQSLKLRAKVNWLDKETKERPSQTTATENSKVKLVKIDAQLRTMSSKSSTSA